MSMKDFSSFLDLFEQQKPKGYQGFQELRDKDKFTDKLNTGMANLEEIGRGDTVAPLVEVRKKVDKLQLTVLQMAARWNETEASKVTQAIAGVQGEVDKIEKEVDTAEGQLSYAFWRPEKQQTQLDALRSDIEGIKETLSKELEALKKRPGGDIVAPLAEARKKVDTLRFTVRKIAAETDANKVKLAIESAQKEVDEIEKEVDTAERQLSDVLSRPKDQQTQLDTLRSDIAEIKKALSGELDALNKGQLGPRKSSLGEDKSSIGQKTDFTRDGLSQGWVPDSKGGEGVYQYQSDEEVENLKKRGVDQQFDSFAKLTEIASSRLNKVGVREIGKDSVETANNLKVAKERLTLERNTAAVLRSGMTDAFNKRLEQEGPGKQAVLNNAKMAQNLVTALVGAMGPNAKLDKGLLSRAMGDTDGQGQIDAATESGKVQTIIGDISGRAGTGKLDPGDANTMQQFISAFVDGLTEVTEGLAGPIAHFDKVWEKLAPAFGLKESDKAKLLQRVDVYKKLANGVADTGDSGKKVRKTFTRDMKGNKRVPLSDNTIEDPEALISNDISGSMHSQFLAMELAETLSGNSKDEFGQDTGKLKDPGASVQIKNKDVLNIRMVDALTLTAGGKLDGGRGDDFIMHTAYEMINGAQAMVGFPNKISQKEATEIMDLLAKGKQFTDAMEEAMPNEVFPWTVSSQKGLDDRVGNNKGDDAALKGVVEDVLGFPNMIEKVPTKLKRNEDEEDADYQQRCYEDFVAKVTDAIKSGKACSEALAEAMPDNIMPWHATDEAALNKRVGDAITRAGGDKEKVQKAVTGAIYDILEFVQGLRAPRPEKVKEVSDQITVQKKSFTEAMTAIFPTAEFPWS